MSYVPSQYSMTVQERSFEKFRDDQRTSLIDERTPVDLGAKAALFLDRLIAFRRAPEKKSRSVRSKKVTNDMQVKSKSEGKVQIFDNVPKDAAIHFGQFYGLQDNQFRSSRNKTKQMMDRALRSTPKSEFTRQMVYKLQQSAGTKEYAQQVTALLEETVEPPNFKLDLPPAESSIPNGKQDPSGYPLWYKEPDEMPFATAKQKVFVEDYKNTGPMKEIFTEDTSTNEDYSSEENDLEDTTKSTSLDVKLNDGQSRKTLNDIESKFSMKLKPKAKKNKSSNSSISSESSCKSTESFQTNETSSSSLSSFVDAVENEANLPTVK